MYRDADEVRTLRWLLAVARGDVAAVDAFLADPAFDPAVELSVVAGGGANALAVATEHGKKDLVAKITAAIERRRLEAPTPALSRSAATCDSPPDSPRQDPAPQDAVIGAADGPQVLGVVVDAAACVPPSAAIAAWGAALASAASSGAARAIALRFGLREYRRHVALHPAPAAVASAFAAMRLPPPSAEAAEAVVAAVAAAYLRDPVVASAAASSSSWIARLRAALPGVRVGLAGCDPVCCGTAVPPPLDAAVDATSFPAAGCTAATPAAILLRAAAAMGRPAPTVAVVAVGATAQAAHLAPFAATLRVRRATAAAPRGARDAGHPPPLESGGESSDDCTFDFTIAPPPSASPSGSHPTGATLAEMAAPIPTAMPGVEDDGNGGVMIRRGGGGRLATISPAAVADAVGRADALWTPPTPQRCATAAGAVANKYLRHESSCVPAASLARCAPPPVGGIGIMGGPAVLPSPFMLRVLPSPPTAPGNAPPPSPQVAAAAAAATAAALPTAALPCGGGGEGCVHAASGYSANLRSATSALAVVFTDSASPPHPSTAAAPPSLAVTPPAVSPPPPPPPTATPLSPTPTAAADVTGVTWAAEEAGGGGVASGATPTPRRRFHRVASVGGGLIPIPIPSPSCGAGVCSAERDCGGETFVLSAPAFHPPPPETPGGFPPGAPRRRGSMYVSQAPPFFSGGGVGGACGVSGVTVLRAAALDKPHVVAQRAVLRPSSPPPGSPAVRADGSVVVSFSAGLGACAGSAHFLPLVGRGAQPGSVGAGVCELVAAVEWEPAAVSSHTSGATSAAGSPPHPPAAATASKSQVATPQARADLRPAAVTAAAAAPPMSSLAPTPAATPTPPTVALTPPTSAATPPTGDAAASAPPALARSPPVVPVPAAPGRVPPPHSLAASAAALAHHRRASPDGPLRVATSAEAAPHAVGHPSGGGLPHGAGLHAGMPPGLGSPLPPQLLGVPETVGRDGSAVAAVALRVRAVVVPAADFDAAADAHDAGGASAGRDGEGEVGWIAMGVGGAASGDGDLATPHAMGPSATFVAAVPQGFVVVVDTIAAVYAQGGGLELREPRSAASLAASPAGPTSHSFPPAFPTPSPHAPGLGTAIVGVSAGPLADSALVAVRGLRGWRAVVSAHCAAWAAAWQAVDIAISPDPAAQRIARHCAASLVTSGALFPRRLKHGGAAAAALDEALVVAATFVYDAALTLPWVSRRGAAVSSGAAAAIAAALGFPGGAFTRWDAPGGASGGLVGEALSPSTLGPPPEAAAAGEPGLGSSVRVTAAVALLASILRSSSPLDASAAASVAAISAAASTFLRAVVASQAAAEQLGRHVTALAAVSAFVADPAGGPPRVPPVAARGAAAEPCHGAEEAEDHGLLLWAAYGSSLGHLLLPMRAAPPGGTATPPDALAALLGAAGGLGGLGVGTREEVWRLMAAGSALPPAVAAVVAGAAAVTGSPDAARSALADAYAAAVALPRGAARGAFASVLWALRVCFCGVRTGGPTTLTPAGALNADVALSPALPAHWRRAVLRRRVRVGGFVGVEVRATTARVIFEPGGTAAALGDSASSPSSSPMGTFADSSPAAAASPVVWVRGGTRCALAAWTPVEVQHGAMLTMAQFSAIMARTRVARSELVYAYFRRLRAALAPTTAFPELSTLTVAGAAALLRHAHASLLAVPAADQSGREGRASLALGGQRVEVDLHSELTELEKDIVWLDGGDAGLLRALRPRHADFDAAVSTCVAFLARASAAVPPPSPGSSTSAGTPISATTPTSPTAGARRKAFRLFVTDRDGTVVNYCGRYASSVQAAYNAVWLTRFAVACADASVVLTAAPLSRPGLLDVTTLPAGVFVFGASGGREYVDASERRGRAPMLADEAQLLGLFNRRVTTLTSRPPHDRFALIGSGVQAKFACTSVARNDIGGSIPAAESLTWLELLRATAAHCVRECAVAADLRVHDTGLDVEVSVVSTLVSSSPPDAPPASGGAGWDKGKGLDFLASAVGLDLETGPTLVCGDTPSDLPMLAVAQRRCPHGTAAVFVTRNPALEATVRATCPMSLIVPTPDVLVAALNVFARNCLLDDVARGAPGAVQAAAAAEFHGLEDFAALERADVDDGGGSVASSSPSMPSAAATSSL